MSIFEAIGYAVIIATSCLGFIVCGWATYRHLTHVLSMSKRGEVETLRDVREAMKVREAIQ